MDRILIITDSYEINWGKILRNYNIDSQFIIHSININSDKIINEIKDNSKFEKINIKSLNINKMNKIIENKARDYYLKLIKDLPSTKLLYNYSIDDLLTINSRNYWWYLPISEKNIWTDKSIHRFYEIIKLKYIFDKNSFKCVISNLNDGILQNVFDIMTKKRNLNFLVVKQRNKKISGKNESIKFLFKFYKNAIKAIFVLIVKKIFIIGNKRYNNRYTPDGSIGFISLFPLFWKDLEKIKPRDIFFNKIPEQIELINNVQHFVWISPFKNIFSIKKQIKKFTKNNNVSILEKHLSIKKALSIFNPRLIKNLFFILFNKEKIELGNIYSININDIVYDEFIESFSSSALFQSLLIDSALKEFSLHKLKMLFYRLEFQPHEKAFLYNAKGKVQSIGFQHSALSKNFLNYVFVNDELKLHWENRNHTKSMPLPDKIFTSGKIGFDFFCLAGYPPSNIDIVGGIRFSNIVDFKKTNPNKLKLKEKYQIPLNKKIIFAPTSLFINETLDMLDAYLNVNVVDINEFFIVIKCHPASKKSFINTIENYLSSILNNNLFIIIHEEVNNYELIYLSDYCLFLGGSMAIEALALNTTPIVYFPQNNFSHNPIIDYRGLIQHAYDRKSMNKIFNGLNRDIDADDRKEMIGRFFSNLDKNPDDIFLSKYNKLYNEVN